MKFKFRPSFGLSYQQQGLIYFTCANFSQQSPEVQHKIINLCMEVGGEHYQALFYAVTTERNLLPIAAEHYLDESWLWRMCRKFYQKWETRK